MAEKPSLTLKRRIAAAPEKIFAAWTDPKKIVCWWGTAGSTTLHAETDPREGGRFAVGFRTPDGEVHDVSGTYREVEPNKKLVFTWAWKTTPERQSLVTLTLKPEGAETILTLLHEQFADELARDDHNRGWSETLERLEAYLVAAG
jgi:uncharacterized protein YndB with AHSA1/START domain